MEFLYGMFKIKLLTLRKTLIELLNKGYIKINNFSVKAFVFFVKELSGKFRFYYDYKKLNVITVRNKYFLSLI